MVSLGAVTAAVTLIVVGMVVGTSAQTTTDFPATTNEAGVDCVLSDWTEFGPCSTTCEEGQQLFGRNVIVEGSNGGMACPDELTETRTCNLGPCPIDCVVSNWTLGECSVTCGGGVLVQTRTVVVEAMHGGEGCPALNETVACNTDACPRPAILTRDSDIVIKYPYGSKVVFEELPGLYQDEMPGNVVQLDELQLAAAYEDARAEDLWSINSQISNVDSTASSALSNARGEIESQTSSDLGAAVNGLENELDTTREGLEEALADSMSTLENSISQAQETLAAQISRSKSMSDALTTSQVAALSNGVASDIRESASDTLDSAMGYTGDAVASAITTAQGYADAVADAAEGNANDYTDDEVSSARAALHSEVLSARSYANSVGSSTLSNAKAYADNVAADAESGAVSTANAYTNSRTTSFQSQINSLQGAVNGINNELDRCGRTCPAGQYVSRWCTSSSSNSCSNCPAHTYSPTTSLDGACLPCSPQYCSVGTYYRGCSRTSSSGASSCPSCPGGKYQDSTLHRSTSCKTCSCPGGYYLWSCDRITGPVCHYYGIKVIGRNGCDEGQWYKDGKLTGCETAFQWGAGMHNRLYLACHCADNYDQNYHSTVQIISGRYQFYCAADDCCRVYLRGPGVNGWIIDHGCGGCRSCGGHSHVRNLATGTYYMRFWMHEYGGGDWWDFRFRRY